MHRLHLLTFAVVVAASTACDNNPVAPSDVVGSTWRLVALQEAGAPPVQVSDPSRYTLTLGPDGRAAVKSDCNSCGGSYELSGSSLHLGPIACTKVFCGSESLDPAYARAIERAESVSLKDAEMTIQGQGLALQFTR